MAKYSKGAGKDVKEALHEMKKGKLKSGQSGKKVTNPKQAIAIGLSEAREKGEKVPAKKAVGKSASKSVSKSKGASKASGSKSKTASKKSATKSSGSASKKAASRSKK